MSWIKIKTIPVLQHEQGHFDMGEIFALRLKKSINESGIVDFHDFFTAFKEKYEKMLEECNEEESKYDVATQNTLGVEYYTKWIKDELEALKPIL
ncbi:hypothetical protein ACX0G9_11455 [Flavitalea flava]